MKSLSATGAFSLVECCFTLMIMGLLMMLALPNYQYTKARAAHQQARIQLQSLANEMEIYHLFNQTYEGGWKQPATLKQGYNYYLDECDTHTYHLRAEPKQALSKTYCGAIMLNSRGRIDPGLC